MTLQTILNAIHSMGLSAVDLNIHGVMSIRLVENGAQWHVSLSMKPTIVVGVISLSAAIGFAGRLRFAK